ncbi:MAG TPA: aminotransferase class III-fold pyridoxal phosphate-dependent enzyme [Thermoanaerobaculia bacterium]|nr:aminotransferase class III-fold pyridoxal phosphate-dependent enzyme [Thermoanaerobaculia bacterium]
MSIAHRRPAAPSSIEEAYRRRSPRSAELHARARRVLPGGNSRQAAFWEPYPLSIERASGSRLYDVDGNEYLDLVYNYTSMVHGHAYPPILEAVDLARGSGWTASNQAMIELAELIVGRVPAMERIRFTNSGTEAGLLALTLARELTGRYRVLMARGGYHGSLPEFESGTFGHPGPATLLAEYGDLTSFERVLAERGDEVAAVVIEPVQGAGGVVRGAPEFLRGLCAATRRAGALFVLDEVITFRLATGGVQGEIGLDPDLTMLGKIIGGGFPVGAVGGKRELLDVLDPTAADRPPSQSAASHRSPSQRRSVFHSGTYNANPVTMAAGAVSVRELTAERIARIDRLAERLEQGLGRAAERCGLPAKVRRVGSLVAFQAVRPGPEAAAAPPAGISIVPADPTPAIFHLAALNHGLLLAPRGMMAVATVLDEAAIDEAIERAAAAMADVQGEAPR